jgi:Mn-dependent DtxR family transcriptional regulator
MPREPVPEELRRFILTTIPSVPFVEAMLIYMAAHGEPVETTLLAQRLYVSAKAAEEIATQLREARMVEAVPGQPARHRFAPQTGELAAYLGQLAMYYRTNLVDVTDLIHARTVRRAQQFADAFKLRKDP